MGPEAVEQTVQPRAVLTVLFRRFRASVAHHVDVRACAEVLPHAVQHKEAEQGAVCVLKRACRACAPRSTPLEHLTQFGDHLGVEGVVHRFPGQPDLEHGAFDLKLKMLANGL